MDIHRLLSSNTSETDDNHDHQHRKRKAGQQATTSTPPRSNELQQRALPNDITRLPQSNVHQNTYHAEVSDGNSTTTHHSRTVILQLQPSATSAPHSHHEKSYSDGVSQARAYGSASQNPPTIASPSTTQSGLRAPPVIRTLSNRSLATVAMDEGPAQTPTPRTFSSSDLSEAELSTVTDLLGYLNEHSYAYDSHIQLINLLHKGFVAHTADSENDPTSYSMLSELRQARAAMDSRFAVGENLWLDWLSDEILLVQSVDERLAITELLQKATQDEPMSSRIWQIYVDWVEMNYAACFDIDNLPHTSISDDDKEICRALFTRDMLRDVLEQAATALQWRLDDGSVLYNKYLSFLTQQAMDSEARDSAMSLTDLESIFMARLQVPHTGMDETKQLFWPVVRELYGNKWSQAMKQFDQTSKLAKEQMSIRSKNEDQLQSIIDSDDQEALLAEFQRLMKWEKTQTHRSPFHKNLRSALYERGLLHFPTMAEWWIDYIDFVISQQPSTHNPSSSTLPLIERATRHCPWSGELWARRILRSDYERKTYDEIEATKHRATNSSLLDVGGMEDLLKVLVEWCSYLRRHAFSATASEDNIDTAEVGITMALEDMQQAGKRLYGDSFKGDPLFRIEQIQIKFLSEARRLNDARAVWQSLVPSKRNSYEFWQKYYTWEITVWIVDRTNDDERVETTETGPQLATAVIEEALSQHKLDWPEKIADLYVDHFQHHESVEKGQAATITVYDFRKKIISKRAKEAEMAAQQQAAHQAAEAESATHTAPEYVQAGDKRKRENDDDTQEPSDVKKIKTTEELAADAAQKQKRDREHLSITISNIPAHAREQDIRIFLRGCGDIASIAIAPTTKDSTTSAAVEFEQREDVEFARLRNGRPLLGNEVEIHNSTQSTLYVTNYPPSYDEEDVRKLFTSYGEITSIRFPSLKFNNRRRFCYVQFVSYTQAKVAEAALDGKKIDGAHQLLAKISNPDAKRQRSGPQAEGREIFVKNIDNETTEEEVKAFFEQYGVVESVKLLKNAKNKRLGNGFIVFATAEETDKAVQEAHGQPIKDRILNVARSTPKGGIAPVDHAQKQDIIVKHADDEQSSNGRRGSDISMLSVASQGLAENTTRQRQVGLFNLPSTVTDARIVAELEKQGRVVRIQLRREQDAAIVEFEDIKTATDVRAGIEFAALGPECKSGDVKDLFNQHKKRSTGLKPTTISRPAQRGARRGGLGFKRALAPTNSTHQSTEGVTKPARSNADFKAMFAQGKEAKDPE